MVGKATKYGGGHVRETERLNRTGSNWNDSRSKEFDDRRRSAAYPGDSTVVIHDSAAAPEEFVHMMTRTLGETGTRDLPADDAQRRAVDAAGGSLNGSMAYYGFGNKAERRDAMSITKAVMAARGLDAGSASDREAFMKSLETSDGLPDASKVDALAAPGNAKAALKALQLLRYKKSKGVELNDPEKEADSDFGRDDLWIMASTGEGTMNAVRAAIKGGKTKKGGK